MRKRAERRGWVWDVEDEGLGHSPGAGDAEVIGFKPVGFGKGIAELLAGADEDDVDRVAGQAVAGDGEAPGHGGAGGFSGRNGGRKGERRTRPIAYVTPSLRASGIL